MDKDALINQLHAALSEAQEWLQAIVNSNALTSDDRAAMKRIDAAMEAANDYQRATCNDT